jgi:hypothetical protein
MNMQLAHDFISWSDALAYFFGGVFSANALPHLIAGIRGECLQTPFAAPPFRGLSSPFINVAWSLANLLSGYCLIVHVGTFAIHDPLHFGCVFLGFSAMALQCARAFARLQTHENA